MAKARDNSDLQFLASPVSGGIHTIRRFKQVFLMPLLDGAKTPVDCAAFTWQLIAAQGQRPNKEGKMVETEEKNLREFKGQASKFGEKDFPVLLTLQIA